MTGALVGAFVLWQMWWLLQRGSPRKATARKDLDVESGVKSTGRQRELESLLN